MCIYSQRVETHKNPSKGLKRAAATGGGNSPSLDITLALLAQNKVLERIDQAIAVVEARIAAS